MLLIILHLISIINEHCLIYNIADRRYTDFQIFGMSDQLQIGEAHNLKTCLLGLMNFKLKQQIRSQMFPLRIQLDYRLVF
ncbi:unnamed protein product [Paramecium pentaurelia]|uniref:Uncharacterized protein n=1 Tax=Paramecium pentaurelia TaxID=43138 RepID=A0A8S1WIX2_9CILI|nr:unnamed protein product [Paramecium pentaurelia]